MTDYDPANPPFYIIAQGDDTLVEGPPALEEWLNNDGGYKVILEDYGFISKFEKYTFDITDLDYCSRYFYPSDNNLGLILLPKPWKVLYKMPYKVRPTDDPLLHYRGVALGLYADSRGVPFLRKVVDRYMELTETIEADPIINYYSIHVVEDQTVTAETWDLMYKRYGLGPEHEAHLVEELNKVTSLPWKLRLPWLTEDVLSYDID